MTNTPIIFPAVLFCGRARPISVSNISTSFRHYPDIVTCSTIKWFVASCRDRQGRAQSPPSPQSVSQHVLLPLSPPLAARARCTAAAAPSGVTGSGQLAYRDLQESDETWKNKSAHFQVPHSCMYMLYREYNTHRAVMKLRSTYP